MDKWWGLPADNLGGVAERSLAAVNFEPREITLDRDWSQQVFRIVNVEPDLRASVRLGWHVRNAFPIILAPCNLTCLRPRRRQCVCVEGDRQIKVNVMHLVEKIENALPNLLRWEVSFMATAVPKVVPPLALEDADTYVMAPVIDAHGSSAPVAISSASTAVVPAQERPDVAMVLGLLFDDAQSGGDGLRFSGMDGPRWETIANLASRNIVAVNESEFGEQHLQLKPGSYSLQSAVVLSGPVEAFRSLSGLPPLKLPKLYHLMRMQEQGFERMGVLPPPLEPAARLLCLCDLRKPISYFAALACREDIWAKGVGHILHTKTDGYYRCLLTLPADKVQHGLLAIEDKQDAYFVEQLKLEGQEHDADVEAIQDGNADAVALLALGDVDALVLQAPVVPGSQWVRCAVDFGEGTRVQKIWFDNCTGGSGTRRGFTNCPVHGCIKYKDVYADRLEYAVAMYLWLQEAMTTDCDRFDHLRFWPTDVDVHAAKMSARLVNF